MNDTETAILNLLQPGDFVRFIFRPDKEGKLEIGVEGGSDASAGRLGERIGLVLGGTRSRRYLFRKDAAKPEGVASGVPARWVEIRPRAASAYPLRGAEIGFGSVGSEAGRARLRLPDFTSRLPGGPGAPLAAVCGADHPEIRSMEVEFVGRDLSPEEAPLLEAVLSSQAHVSGRRAPGDTPVEAFLMLWLLHRTGWTVALRALIADDASVPVVLLEMTGDDFFACPCEVFECSGTPQTKDLLDLASAFPRQWPFPAILPVHDLIDSLAASRLHNRRLPRLPQQGLVIGEAEGKRVRLPSEARDRHTYIVGATGTGKSTLLERMIHEDVKAGRSLVLLDPHGDLYHRIKNAASTASDARRVFCLDPSEDAALPPFNILDIPPGPLRHRQASLLVGELMRFFGEVWNMREAGGPMFEMYFRNTLLLMCLQKPEREPLHMGEFAQVLTEKAFRKELLDGCQDPSVVEFWTRMAEKAAGDVSMANIAPYIASKVNGLVQTGFLAKLLCQRGNEIRIGERMGRGEIILINLNKGLLGTYESRLLGTILMMEVFSAGLARAALPETEFGPVSIYVDEFQNFVSDNAASMLSEARKFGLCLTLANQTLGQLKAHSGRQDLLETVLGNVGNLIAFRLGVPDADRLRLFLEPFTPAEMRELPNFHAFARILTAEGPIRPLIFRTLRPCKRNRVTEGTRPVTPICRELDLATSSRMEAIHERHLSNKIS